MAVSSGQDRRGYGRIKAIAEYKGVSTSTVRRLLKSGELPYFRLPSGTVLIAYRDVDEWIERYKVGNGPDYVEQVVEEIASEMLGG